MAVAVSNLCVEEHSIGYAQAPLAEVLGASVLLLFWQAWYAGTVWTELPRCQGGAWWPVAFSNLLVEEHSRDYAHASLAEGFAVSVLLFYWQAQYEGQRAQSSQDVKVMLGGQLRSQTCL